MITKYFFVEKRRNFWDKPELKPAWWPRDVPFSSASRKLSKRKLVKILSCYKLNRGSSMPQSPSNSYRCRSPHNETNDNTDVDEVEETTNTDSELPDILLPIPDPILISDESSDSLSSMFPELHQLQSPSRSTTLKHTPTMSLAKLANAKEINPLSTTLITTILNENTRSRSLLELSDKNTFLSDISINAFCVSFL